MLKFKKASDRQSALETIGSVASFVGVGGYHQLASEKNFKNLEKKVSIKLVNKDNDFEYVNCSKPVGDWLRESTAEELPNKLAELATFPILKLPQVDRETGEPILVANEETGEMEQLVLYSISFAGATDMSATRTKITEAMVKSETAKRAVDWNSLVSI
jgi:hypothetical protein